MISEKHSILLLFSIIVFTFISCSNSTESSDNQESFTGYSHTGDNSPDIIGVIDTTDWTYDKDWSYDNIYSSQKSSIENTVYSPPNSQMSLPASFTARPFYPNPATINHGMLSFSLPVYSEVFIVLINERREILSKIILSTLNAGTWQVSNEKVLPANIKSGMYRIIYRFEDKQSGKYGIYKGHGDILIQ